MKVVAVGIFHQGVVILVRPIHRTSDLFQKVNGLVESHRVGRDVENTHVLTLSQSELLDFGPLRGVRSSYFFGPISAHFTPRPFPIFASRARTLPGASRLNASLRSP